jgi:hypothetical protein
MSKVAPAELGYITLTLIIVGLRQLIRASG